MAWQAFIYLNWPALPGSMGVPDASKSIGAPGPAVWETFQTVDDVFLPDGRKPSPGDRPLGPQAAQFAARVRAGTMRVLTQHSKFTAHVFAERLRLTPLLLSSSDGRAGQLRDTQQSDGNVLVDQNGQFVWYEELLNPAETSYVVDNGLYEATAQNAFASRTPISLPDGCIELKPAWKVLGRGDDGTHFLTSSATLEGGSGTVTVGLVGFHVMMRVAGLNQGVWATFAQVENAPLLGGTSGHFSFYDPSCPANRCQPNSVTSAPTPTQVVQNAAVPSDASAVTDYVATLIRTRPQAAALGYYRLLDVQWPTSSTALPQAPQGVPLPSGSPNTSTLVNPVLETFLQTSNVGCLSSSCHAGASTAFSPRSAATYAAGFSFLFGHAKPAPN